MAAPDITEQIFFFVNPKSGGNKGQDFLKVPQPFVMQAATGHTVNLHIFSLIDAAKREEGFTKLKLTADSVGHRIKVIVGGGDGTVMWADSEATKKGIDTPRQIDFGIVPLGTGNDFSRVAGWGGKNPSKILQKDCAVLRNLVNQWAKAKPRPHDVWQVSVDVEEDGGILKVDGKKEAELKEKSISLPMINYFSVGQESKVGLNFDKHRTKSQTCNLFVYACQGVSTELKCTSIQHVSELVSGMYAGVSSEAPAIFGCDEDADEPEIVGNPECLMFLNVNSYAGGMGHFWSTDAGVGTDPAPNDEDVDVQADPGDGRLECVTLPNIAGIALDQVAHQARRIHSGGPYYLEFFNPPDGVDELHAYCEIDGEFYHLVNPSHCKVVFLKRLQVLQNIDDADMAEWQKWLSPAVWAPPTKMVSTPTFMDIQRSIFDAPKMMGSRMTAAMADAVAANQNMVHSVQHMFDKSKPPRA